MRDPESGSNLAAVSNVHSFFDPRTKIVMESWRRHYNTKRPHGSLGYKPPAPEVFIPALAARAASQPRPAPPPALAESPTMN